MPIERMTAKKVRIADLTGGQWVKKEGMEPSVVVTPGGEQVSRARILGTVVSVFIAEDEMFASITLDDQTDTIRLKTFKTAEPLSAMRIGDLVDVVGKVREYNGELYLIPEVITKVRDPHWELLRKLEILAQRNGGNTKSAVSKGGNELEKDAIRKQSLAVLDRHPEGVSFHELVQSTGASPPVAEAVIDELLAEGICYEPTPGKIKKI